MKQSRSIGTEPNFSRIILVSAILHLIFISLASVPIITSKERTLTYHVNLVGPLQTVRRARVPEKKTRMPVTETKKRRVPPKKVVKETPKADMSLETVEKVAKEIEKMRAIKSISEKRKESGEKAQEIQIGKNQESADKSSEGAGFPGTGEIKEGDLYYSIISRMIWEQWAYPTFRASGLEVVISIKIDGTGRVISQLIEKSSGDRLFDRSALKAISSASPFPPPPEEIEIGVRFYL